MGMKELGKTCVGNPDERVAGRIPIPPSDCALPGRTEGATANTATMRAMTNNRVRGEDRNMSTFLPKNKPGESYLDARVVFGTIERRFENEAFTLI
jgi:hypothetical protein